MQLDEFLNLYPSGVRVLLNDARTVLLERFTSLREEPDLPSRILVYRIAPGNDGVVFTLIPSRAGVKLGVYRGRELADPNGLLQGSGKVHATIPLSETTFNDQALIHLLDAAMQNADRRITRRNLMSDKPIFEKLQLKPGRKMLIVNPPTGYLEKAGAIPPGAELVSEPQEVFIIQVFVRLQVDLEEALSRYAPLVQTGGMLWITYPKLTSTLKGDIHRDTINAYAQQNGWTGIAITSIDNDWSALRLKRV